MGAHVVFTGPSTAGKTSLMLGLSRLECDMQFSLERTLTTRIKRPNEGNDENEFLTPEEFELRQEQGLLFTFGPEDGRYHYGITIPRPVDQNEIRMRILRPHHAVYFRTLVETPTLICAVSPYETDPQAAFLRRDPEADPADIAERMSRFHKDQNEAEAVADVHFQNQFGLEIAVRHLSCLLLEKVS